MKKKWVSFVGKLGDVKENLFTLQGSSFYFIPQNKDLLFVMEKWQRGSLMKVYAYKMSEDSCFFSVGKVSFDKYHAKTKAKTRRVVAYAEMDRLTVQRQAERHRRHPSGKHTGLSAKGIVKNKEKGELL